MFNLEGIGKAERPGENGGLAQLGERLPCKQEVSGSIPLISSIPKTQAFLGALLNCTSSAEMNSACGKVLLRKTLGTPDPRRAIPWELQNMNMGL